MSDYEAARLVRLAEERAALASVPFMERHKYAAAKALRNWTPWSQDRIRAAQRILDAYVAEQAEAGANMGELDEADRRAILSVAYRQQAADAEARGQAADERRQTIRERPTENGWIAERAEQEVADEAATEAARALRLAAVAESHDLPSGILTFVPSTRSADRAKARAVAADEAAPRQAAAVAAIEEGAQAAEERTASGAEAIATRIPLEPLRALARETSITALEIDQPDQDERFIMSRPRLAEVLRATKDRADLAIEMDGPPGDPRLLARWTSGPGRRGGLDLKPDVSPRDAPPATIKIDLPDHAELQRRAKAARLPREERRRVASVDVSPELAAVLLSLRDDAEAAELLSAEEIEEIGGSAADLVLRLMGVIVSAPKTTNRVQLAARAAWWERLEEIRAHMNLPEPDGWTA